MDEDGRLDVKHWDMTFEPSIREHHYHNQGLKFMSVLTDRDAGIFERNGAASDKKSSTSMEKEASVFPRDVGYGDRNSVYLHRDAQVAPFDYARDGTSWNVQRSIPSGPVANAKILQVLAENPLFSTRDFHSARPVSTAYPSSFYEAQPAAEEPLKTIKHHHAAYRKREGEKESPSKSSEKLETKVAARPKKQKKQTACSSNGDFAAVPKKEQKSMDVVINGVIVDISTMPIPVCSCTGTPQQCYRWGNGGWQSACCTTSISLYPLPLNPKRRGARVAGRKMSGGAFKKLLERLGAEGHNLNYPIDLKSYWAKHGTNKFVTIR